MTTPQHVDILLDLRADPAAGRVGLPSRVRGACFAPAARRGWAALAAAVIVALLLGFHHVVRDAVRQGEALRAAVSSRAEASWRCRALAREALRASCLARLDAPPAPHADGAPPPDTAALAVAGTGS